jgi:RNA 3'-terminal phosphate cyclase (ATP)
MSTTGPDMLVIDGSYGEGGGQILRTALTLAVLTGRPLRIERIRAGRRKPGLAAQHLTAVRAAATIGGAVLDGDTLGSQSLEFRPGSSPVPGDYHFDVAQARKGGSAGAATLVLQTVALPLALASDESTVTARGGTHVPWSPSFDYFESVWLEMLRRLGLKAEARLNQWGFYPAGGGEIVLHLGRTRNGVSAPLSPLAASTRGALTAIEGRTVAANLPSHIAQRMADRAGALLRPLGVPTAIKAERVRAVSPGAWIFLKAGYANCLTGFGAHGRRGKPSEAVAEEAVAGLLDFHRGPAALDSHLADQMLLPLAFASGPSEFTCASVSRHLETNAWAIEQFEAAVVEIRRRPDGTGHVEVTPHGLPEPKRKTA